MVVNPCVSGVFRTQTVTHTQTFSPRVYLQCCIHISQPGTEKEAGFVLDTGMKMSMCKTENAGSSVLTLKQRAANYEFPQPLGRSFETAQRLTTSTEH